MSLTRIVFATRNADGTITPGADCMDLFTPRDSSPGVIEWAIPVRRHDGYTHVAAIARDIDEDRQLALVTFDAPRTPLRFRVEKTHPDHLFVVMSPWPTSGYIGDPYDTWHEAHRLAVRLNAMSRDDQDRWHQQELAARSRTTR